MNAKNTLAQVAFGGSVAAVSLLGSRRTQKSVNTWYRFLRKPKFQPPRGAFPIVWTGLYAAIAVAGYRVWRAPASPERTRALKAWGTQLAANAAWSELFFARKRADLALADLAVMLPSIITFMVNASKVDRLAAGLFAPYLGWVSFASVLNEEALRLNPRWSRGRVA